LKQHATGEVHSNYVFDFQNGSTTMKILCRHVRDLVKHFAPLKRVFQRLRELHQFLPGLFPKPLRMDHSESFLCMKFIVGPTLNALPELHSDALAQYGHALAKLHNCTKLVQSAHGFILFEFHVCFSRIYQSCPTVVPSDIKGILARLDRAIADEFAGRKNDLDVVLSHGHTVLTNAIYCSSGEVRLLGAENLSYCVSGYDLATVIYETSLSAEQSKVIIDKYARTRWPNEPIRQEEFTEMIALGATIRAVNCLKSGFEQLGMRSTTGLLWRFLLLRSQLLKHFNAFETFHFCRHFMIT
jgi:hypothetical protein